MHVAKYAGMSLGKPGQRSSTDPQQTTNFNRPPFPFRKLPAESRRDIYRICLIDIVDIAVEVDYRFDSHNEREGYKYEELVHLGRGIICIGGFILGIEFSSPLLNPNILPVSSTVSYFGSIRTQTFRISR